MVDSKENNKLDLGVKGLNSIMVRRTLTKKIAIRSSNSHSKYRKRKKKPLFSTINLNQFQKSTEKQVGIGHSTLSVLCHFPRLSLFLPTADITLLS